MPRCRRPSSSGWRPAARAQREEADCLAAAERAEADRIANEARIAEEQILAARRAELEKQQAEAEADRRARIAEEQRQARLHKAAPALLDALVICIPYIATHGTADELAQCNAAIDAAA